MIFCNLFSRIYQQPVNNLAHHDQIHVNQIYLESFLQNQQQKQEQQTKQQAIYKASKAAQQQKAKNISQGSPSSSSDDSDVDNNCPANSNGNNAVYSSPKTHHQTYLNKATTTQQLQQFNQIQQLQLEQYLAQQRPSLLLRSASDESLPCALNNDLFPPIGLKPCQRVRQPHFTPEQLIKVYQAQQQLNQLRLNQQPQPNLSAQNLNQIMSQGGIGQQNLAQQPQFMQHQQQPQQQPQHQQQHQPNIPEQLRVQLLLQQRAQQQMFQQQQLQQARLKQLYNHGLNYTLPRQPSVPSVQQLQFAVSQQQSQQRSNQQLMLQRANSVPESVDNMAVMTNLLLHNIEPIQQRINLEEFKNQLLQNQHHLNQQINVSNLAGGGMSGPMGNQMGGQIGNIGLANQMSGQHLSNQMNSQMSSQMSNQLNSQLNNQLNSQMNNQLNNQMNSQLTNQLADQQLACQSQQPPTNPQMATVQTTAIVNQMQDKLLKDGANLPSSVSSTSTSSSDSSDTSDSSNTKWTIG